MMADELVMRSVYLRPLDDAKLRQLAHEFHVSKSDLIRSAISAKLRDWLDSDHDTLILEDLQLGVREPGATRMRAEVEQQTGVAAASASQPKSGARGRRVPDSTAGRARAPAPKGRSRSTGQPAGLGE